MKIKEILAKVDNISGNVNYWFIRTTYGEHFYEFTKGEYIAIGWDYFTLDEILKNNQSYIKNKIALQSKFDPENPRDKMKITSAYNKIKTFINLKKNDIVVVPSRNSNQLAFGRVIDDNAYEVSNLVENGTHFKRRKIEWIDIKNIKSLNPIFYQVKSNQHSISNIKRFAPYIDRVIGNLYKKGDETHFVLNIEKEENINFEDLRSLMDNINILINNINEDLGFNDNLDDFFVKINLQSKGTIELIKAGKSLAVLAFLLTAVSCGTLDNQDDIEIQKIINKNKKVLLQTGKDIDTLQVNTSELNNTFSNGK
ncbi:hypothetical protein [Flavobacterium sp. CF136]|uniref:hypothetical protein n=1 Tax=Flavobacterium sp. (strain CF136) TaxID=1144313 RepID=UPI0002716B73|nr:hypothetical protein [Flavobacterium sp. CF136]EJL64979.1 hypothetical protein PMI10_01530 [Flavobacterium sp. CF136]